jgi:hypothetical protein
MAHVRWLVGLDLGKQRDYTALAVVEREELYPPGTLDLDKEVTKKTAFYAVRHLQRWPLGTSYTHIVKDVAALLARPPLPNCKLVVDSTGVGNAVIDQLRVAIVNGMPAQLVPMVLTGGTKARPAGGGWHLPKQEMVGVLQVLLQNERLKVSEVPDRETLLKEFRTFKIKLSPTTGNASFEAWRESDHDDLVFAVGLPLWLAEKVKKPGPGLKVFKIRSSGLLSEKDCQPRLKIVVCPRAQLAELAIPDHPALLVNIVDPGCDLSAHVPPHALGKLLGHLNLVFADVTPEEHKDTWHDLIPPYGKPVSEVMLDQTSGKRLWHFLLRQHDCNPEVYVIVDDGDRRALSLAYAVCDALLFPRKGTIYCPDDPDEDHTGPAPNKHIFELTKSCRALVM